MTRLRVGGGIADVMFMRGSTTWQSPCHGRVMFCLLGHAKGDMCMHVCKELQMKTASTAMLSLSMLSAEEGGALRC